jgi:hypothetical protein
MIKLKDILKEDDMGVTTGPSKADVHYKVNHPILTILTIKDDKSGYSHNRGTTRMQIIFGMKSNGMGQMMDPDKLMRDASIISSDICKKLENYNTSYSSGRPQQEGNTIVVPVRVEHWTGD